MNNDEEKKDKSKVDMTGLLQEKVELSWGKDTYYILADPDTQYYIRIQHILLLNPNTKKYYDDLIGLFLDMICEYNPGADRKTLKGQVGTLAITILFEDYLNLMEGKGLLKQTKKLEIPAPMMEKFLQTIKGMVKKKKIKE